MLLRPGVRLGPYEIQSALGAGGMGEVYKARDTRLDRVVAIKVLQPALAADPQFRERFDREARVISQLEHPHICALYDVGDQIPSIPRPHDRADQGPATADPSEPVAFLVMQYLDGETLGARLTRGPLEMHEALTIGSQIADALDKAHGAGIVHRDLKPGNVLLTRAGGASGPASAKLLDFGLAKTRRPALTVAGRSELPTMAPVDAAHEGRDARSEVLTARGTILGTFQYMAPEQLEGKDADPRTDIFAFGALLFEMITGRRAFEGTSQASLIAAILDRDPPPISTSQPLTPPLVDRVVKRCLVKEPAGRWQSASDLADELRWIIENPLEKPGPVAQAAAARGRAPLAWILAAAASLALVTLVTVNVLRGSPQPLVTRLDVVTPPSADPFSFALSQDGRHLAFVATVDGASRIWVRSFDQETAIVLAGTDGASFPFWSPDARAIGFFAEGKLKNIDLTGGAPRVLADHTSSGRGGTWNRDGVIVFAPTGGTGLMQVAATGGEPKPLTELAGGQQSHRWPEFLPDGQRFVFVSPFGPPDKVGVYLGSLDGSKPVRLLAAPTAASGAAPGYLLLMSQGVLVAHRFDASRGEVDEASTPVAQSVAEAFSRGAFSVSAAGVLAVRGSTAVRRQLVWVDRAGKTLDVLVPPQLAGPADVELTTDERRVAAIRDAPGVTDVWLIEVARGILSRLTSDTAVDRNPVWSPDGSRVIFASNRATKFDLFETRSNGESDEQLILASAQDKAPTDWSRDGQTLLYAMTADPKQATDLWALPLMGDRKQYPVVQTGFDDIQGQFSPDGRWVAYASNQTSRYEVYVRPFPGPGGTQQVSSGGGLSPRWRPDGRELFYVSPDNRLMAVNVTPGSRALDLGTPVALFTTRLASALSGTSGGLFSRAQYSVARDGRFLMSVSADDAAAPPISVVLNWEAALKK